MYIPLSFFFNRNAGLALPLIALQYHEVKLHIQMGSASELAAVGVDTSYTPTATLYVTYVFLDTDERRRFAQTSHEYLISQLQHTGSEALSPAAASRTTNVRLNLNHPVKFLTWVVKGAKHGQFTAAALGSKDEKFAPIQSVKLQLNGHDRFTERRGSFFNNCQPFEHFQAAPSAGIYLYSFSLKPAEHQPSGTCNFSRIDNATLIVTTKPCSVAFDDAANVGVASEEVTLANVAGNLTNLLVYAENYNVLRIKNSLCIKATCSNLSGKGAGNQLRVRGLGNDKSTPVASMVDFATMRDYLLREHHKATRYQGNWGKPVPGLEKRTRVW